MDKNIIQYYKICGILLPEKRATPLINQLKPKQVAVMFTEKQKNMQIRTVDGVMLIKQSVIGGSKKNFKIIII
jgi:hypothetical protein